MNVNITQFKLKNIFENMLFIFLSLNKKDFVIFETFLKKHFQIESSHEESLWDSHIENIMNSLIEAHEFSPLKPEELLELYELSQSVEEVCFDDVSVNISIKSLNHLNLLKKTSLNTNKTIEKLSKELSKENKFLEYKFLCDQKDSSFKKKYVLYKSSYLEKEIKERNELNRMKTKNQRTSGRGNVMIM